MIQTFEALIDRLSAWMAADPEHAQLWTSIGLALAIAAIGLLAFEQMKARAAAENN